MNFKKYCDYGMLNITQGGWNQVDGYAVRMQPSAGIYYTARICQIDYIPTGHPDKIIVSGIANKAIEVSVLTLRNDNYLIAELGWKANGSEFTLGTYDKLAIGFRYQDNTNITPNDVNDKKVYNWTDTPHHIHNTSTDTITTLPAVIYADGNNATVGISGNTAQSGTPTPDSPIQPSECGERTGNYLPTPVSATVESSGITIESSGDGIINVSGTRTSGDSPTINLKESVTFNGTYYVHLRNNAVAPSSVIVLRNGTTSIVNITLTSTNLITQIALSNVTIDNIQVYVTSGTSINTQMAISIEQTDSVTEYEPFGVKIPILSTGQTTPVYLGEVETTRRIKKLVLTGEENITSGHLDVSLFNISIDDYIREPILSLICTHYKAQLNVDEWGRVSNKNTCFYVGVIAEFRQLYIRDSSYSTIADFKSYLAAQYAAGTPVCVWYVLAEPTTGIVNEPIRKIGDYADEVSGITIPTIAGANTVDVLTTLKPSEVSLSYTGWHDATVKEKSRNLLNPSDILYDTQFDTTPNPPVFVPSDTLNCSNYIPVTVGTYLRTLNNIAIGNWYYEFDANKNYLRTKSPGEGAPMVISSDVSYIVFNIPKTTDITKYMFARTSTPLPYEPYWK